MLNIFKKSKKNKKVVLLGLDGVPFTLLQEYMEKGLMPQLSKLCNSGSLMQMKSTLPEVSSVAWSSFMTGKNPGEHGIFGFMELDRESYGYTFPNYKTLKTKPVWEQDNIKTVAFNIPQTYPARPMNGVTVSGFVALDLKKGSYPERIYNYLHGMGYKIDVNARLAAEDPEKFFTELFNVFDKRKIAIKNLYENEEWDLFIGTITETDRLHHFFFNSALQGEHYGVFERFYSELDTFIGEMAEKAKNDDALFLTCSDHGFTEIKTEVYINRWLSENGYLTLNGTEGLKGISGNSKAFCLDPARIYIHLEGKYAKGSVKNEDYPILVNELKEKLGKLEYEGEKVIKKVYLKNEIFSGDFSEDGPDLYLLTNYGFDLKGAVNRDSVFGTTHFRGMHTYDDAHLYMSKKENKDGISIEDVAGIIRDHLK